MTNNVPSPDLSTLAATVQPWVDRGELAGAVLLVADRSRVLGEAQAGFADVAGQRPMRADTLFWVASQTKPITATALMMLVDAGTVRLDDPVHAYLPEFRDLWVVHAADANRLVLKRPEQPVKVRELLTHTSGLPFLSSAELPAMDLLPLREAARVYAMTMLLAEPGSRYQYSNAGINAAGAIVQVVSGQPFEDFLQMRLFAPLGMRDTTFRPTPTQLARLAKSYRPNAAQTALEETSIGVLTEPLDAPNRQPVPGGGLFATAGDCALFCQMILNGGQWGGQRFLSEAAVAEMTRRQLPDDMPAKYGLGWEVDAEAYGHGGVYNTRMDIFPRAGRIGIFLVQACGFLGDARGARDAFLRLVRDGR